MLVRDQRMEEACSVLVHAIRGGGARVLGEADLGEKKEMWLSVQRRHRVG